MADAPAPQLAGSQTTEELSPAPRVSVILTMVEGADVDAALALLRRQAYDPLPEVVVVGDYEDDLEGVVSHGTLEDAIGAIGPDTDYLWLLHADARPRPDALAKLVTEIERNEASLAGSKLLIAGTKNHLESVGSATDVFGEPYSGLEEGEIDLQQYDVVREVAFVRSASMLVRRDLAQGLKGLDVLLPPVAAGLDFSQRARLAGGKVISVPSSEVYHQGRCNEEATGWHEQAGRLRAMLTAYSPLTLLWVVPYDFFVSLLDSLGSLLLLKFQPLIRHAQSWLWNLFHLPSTIGLRRRFRPVRSAGDEELFRFQARGSVRLRDLGSELSSRLLSLFDEDQALARRTRRLGTSPGMWGAVIALLVVVVAVRGFLFSGIPDGGFSFPFETPSAALSRWFGGWNETGLGSPDAVHPSIALTGAVSAAFLGAAGAARAIITVGFGFLAVLGMGRLAGRLGLRGPGRYLAGLVAVSGPGVALATDLGSWLALGAASVLPWAVRSAATHPGEGADSWGRYGWAIVGGLLIGSFSPLLAIVPLLFALLWRIWGGTRARLLLGLTVALSGGTAAAAFLVGDPGWVTDTSRRMALDVGVLWPVLIALAVVPVLVLDVSVRRPATVGGLLSVSAVVVGRLGLGGPGVEEAALVLASFGAALVVAAGLDSFSSEPRRLAAVVPSLAILVFSLVGIANGRLGLPEGDINERFDFASTLAEEHGPGRILVASADRGDIPGEARAGPGFWYRLVDGGEMTLDEVWLAERRGGDRALLRAVESISSGSELRPGEALAPFAVDWVVLLGPEFRLDEVLVAQLDLVPTPLDPGSRVYENPGAAPIADSEASVWTRAGTGFAGDEGEGRVTLAVNHHGGWGPDSQRVDWQTSVSAEDGVAVFDGPDHTRLLAVATAGLLLIALALIAVGRLRR